MPSADRVTDEGSGPTEQVVPLVREDVRIARRSRPTARVRVSTHTRVEDQLVEQMLDREEAEIVRVPVGREVTEAPPVRTVGDTVIVPVLEEQLVTERRLVLTEEVHIRLKRTAAPYRENIPVRRQEAVVERETLETPPLDTTSPHTTQEQS